MWAKQKQAGFTIVELLIVIVVIAILAAITIVAYNGIQDRAKNAAAQSAASQAAKKLMAYAVLNNDQYPATLADADIQNTDGSLQYTGGGTTFCVTATTQNVSYFQRNTTQASKGACEGHGKDGVAAITNLITNPSAETDAAYYQNIGNATGRELARVNLGSGAYRGSFVYRVNQPTAGGSIAGYGVLTADSVPVGQYVASLWLRSNQAVGVNVYLEGSAVKSPGSGGGATLVPNTWRRIQLPFSVTTAGTVKVGFLSGTTAPVANTYVEMDGVMLTAGATSYEYADGTTNGWAWNGTAHASTSSGVPQ